MRGPTIVVLNLPDIEVQSRTETPERYEFLVRTTIQRPVCCNVPASRNGTKRVKYRDLPMHGRHVTIMAFFDERYTNAYTEAMNGIARIVNRAGRGYSFRVLRAKLMLASHRKKQEANQP